MNVKDQDVWGFKEDMHGPEYVTLVLQLRPHNPGGMYAPGRLYLNGISLPKLEELRTEIDRALRRQRKRVEDCRRRTEEALAELHPRAPTRRDADDY